MFEVSRWGHKFTEIKPSREEGCTGEGALAGEAGVKDFVE